MSAESSGWEAAYQARPTRDRETPHEDAEWLNDLFQQNGVRRILDLGCGDGRHLAWFGDRAYDMYGLDSAPTALRLAEEWLRDRGLKAELVCSDMTDIPWDDGFFDAVISVKVINHHRIAQIRRAIREVHRVLEPDGLLFVVVGTLGPVGRCTNGVEVEPGTFVLREGREAGVPHHFFVEDELLDEFASFEVVETHQDGNGAACLLLRKPPGERN